MGALLATSLVALGACSSGSGHAKARRTGESGHGASTTATRPTPRPTTTTTAPASGINATDALRAHLIDSVTGYQLQPAGGTGTGPSSLAEAASDAGGGSGASGAAERAALTKAGFRAGYKLLFSSGDRQILEQAYRFADTAGAHRYLDHAFAARVHDGGAPSPHAPVDIPGARVVERSEADSSAALMLFTRGATLVILSTILPAGTDATAVLDPIATEQYQRLAGY